MKSFILCFILSKLLKNEDLSKESGNLILFTALLYSILEMDFVLSIDILIKTYKFNR